MEQKLKILIADDHQLLTSGLKLEIAQWEDFEVAGITSNGKDTVEFCEKQEPDIILMDMQMPELRTLSLVPLIKGCHWGRGFPSMSSRYAQVSGSHLNFFIFFLSSLMHSPCLLKRLS